MGRRFLLILGILLSVPPALRSARAQDGGGRPAPDGVPGAPAELPPLKPLKLPAPDGSPPSLDRPNPNEGESPTRQAKDKDGPPSAPPLEPDEEDGGSRKAKSPSRPLDDPGVTRAEGADDEKAAGRPPASATSSAPAGELDGLPAGRLPVGKQTVAVTVDVQSPTSMNLHQPAKVRLLIRNSGTADALEVRIRDELPDGLKFLSSDHELDGGGTSSILSWTLRTLPAGSEKVIVVTVEPVKTGSLEHGATVWFQTGSSAQTKVLQPKLKVEQSASAANVLKGHAVEFKIRVTNDGDGPARNVRVAARLSPGLRYGSGTRGESEVVTDPIPVLGPGQTEELDPLIADAMVEGPASCTVTAKSPDVIVQDKSDEASHVAKVTVVEPKLAVVVSGPQKRCTDTVATYEVAVSNPGSAAAKKVRVVALIPAGARLTGVLPDRARFDQATRRLQWSIDTLEPGSAPQKLGFDVKVGDVGKYEVSAEAVGTGGLKARNSLVTDVFGMADVDVVVSERQRVIDVGGKTIFLIHLRNYGTKDATNITLSATVSKNLEVTGGFDVPPGLDFRGKDGQFELSDGSGGGIKRLGPGKQLVMGLEVEVKSPEPRVATCRVQVKHDELTEGFEDMAAVKVLQPSSPRPAGTGGR